VSTGAGTVSSASSQAPYHPLYNAVGILPQVQLAERDRPLLEQSNTRMRQDRVTVKIAPPAVIRKPSQEL